MSEAGGDVEDGDFYIGESAAERVWRAMIDALIAEVKEAVRADE